MAYDILGNMVILKEGKNNKKTARKLIKENKKITTVLEKLDRVKGRLRTFKTRYLAGIKTKEAVYRENGCIFKFDVEKCYFSPRLATERLEIAGKCKKKDKVLVLFAGVAPFSIVIAKKSECRVVSVEIGRECYKYAKINEKLNKVDDKVKIIRGDVKKLKLNEKFSKIVMPRPQLKETFLQYIWKLCKKNTEVFYYDFGKDAEKILSKIEQEAKSGKKKIKILNFKKAGEIAPYKYRWRVDLRVIS